MTNRVSAPCASPPPAVSSIYGHSREEKREERERERDRTVRYVSRSTLKQVEGKTKSLVSGVVVGLLLWLCVVVVVVGCLWFVRSNLVY